jgi:hypothetical protein
MGGFATDREQKDVQRSSKKEARYHKTKEREARLTAKGGIWSRSGVERDWEEERGERLGGRERGASGRR